MRYFYDSEFIERGPQHPIELVSLGLVCDDGREYYAVCADGWSPEHADPWLHENVFPFLGGPWKTRAAIAQELKEFVQYTPLLDPAEKAPEFWAYFGDYDWVLLCGLFGRMIDLPKHFPKYCNDIKQEMRRLGVKKSDLPKPSGVNHNALDDARYNKVMLEYVLSREPA